ncbi:XRE family transcriptional regulator [Parendozoicomonas sp. Alg238-R29]|uniref:helix-turn-helix domain-containing protein n=1 Tax=Parendozoicomonas sp. Alg238-R29 TaxID=2993446 RepID=UPI00248E9ECF|nr:XRE family transcriptional regulator [Parendozoicomonas sp. Alg238-R29]
MSTEFNPDRLLLAMARRKMKLKELAASIDISTRSLSLYKNGHEEPSITTIEKIANCLGYATSFFYGEQLEAIEVDSVSFRSMSKMTAAKRNAALAAGTYALAFNQWMEGHFQLPASNIPDLREASPEAAADLIRNKWSLGEMAIKNMVHLLESKGVRVFSLAENNREVDAYSFWKDERPFVFLNTMKSAERSRFDAAHELGHLVLHKHASPSGREIEIEADRFASALLMPAGTVKTSAIKFPTLDQLIKLKKKWSVSVAALVRRLSDLGLITEWHYRSLSIEMSQRGYFKQEPEGTKRETSLILDKVMLALWKEGITREAIAKELLLPVPEISSFLFDLQEPESSSHQKTKPNLSLVN